MRTVIDDLLQAVQRLVSHAVENGSQATVIRSELIAVTALLVRATPNGPPPLVNPPRRWQVWNIDRTNLLGEFFGADERDAAREAMKGKALGLPGAPHPGFSIREVGPWLPVQL